MSAVNALVVNFNGISPFVETPGDPISLLDISSEVQLRLMPSDRELNGGELPPVTSDFTEWFTALSHATKAYLDADDVKLDLNVYDPGPHDRRRSRLSLRGEAIFPDYSERRTLWVHIGSMTLHAQPRYGGQTNVAVIYS